MEEQQQENKPNKEAMAKAILLKIALINRKKQLAKTKETNGINKDL